MSPTTSTRILKSRACSYTSWLLNTIVGLVQTVLTAPSVEGQLEYGLNSTDIATLGGSVNLWVAGYASECPCYIPSDQLMRRGGYEPGWGSSDPAIAGMGDSIMYYDWPCRLLARDSTANANVTGIEQLVTSAVLGMAAS